MVGPPHTNAPPSHAPPAYEPLSPRRRFGFFSALVGAVAVASVIEASLRVIVAAGVLPQPLAWYSVDSQRQADDLAVLIDRQEQSKLVFVGTSMVGEGVDTTTVEAEFPQAGEVYNLALDGAQTPVVERWLENHVRPALDPSTVVWGISSLDLNGNRATPVLEQFEAASATRPGLMGDVIRSAEGLSVTYRYRSFLRDPAAFVGEKTSVAPLPDRPAGDVGNFPLGPEIDYKTVRERARIRSEVLNGFAVGEGEVAALVRELSLLRNEGVNVLVVVMPVPPSYIDLHPNGDADFDEFLAAAAEAADAAEVPIIDAHDWFAEDDFRDHAHLRRVAATRFTLRLAPDLADLLEPC